MTPTQRALAISLQRLGTIDPELLWLTTSIVRVVKHPHADKEVVEERQAQLESAAGGLAIVAVFAAFDVAFEQETGSNFFQQAHEDLRNALEPALCQRLLAYRHVRNVVAHGFRGERSGIHGGDSFEAAMADQQLPQVTWDADKDVIVVKRMAWRDVVATIKEVVETLMNRAG